MEDKDFERLLKICRIRLSEKEKPRIKSDIEEVITYFNVLEEVRTEGVEAAYHPLRVPEKLREDKVEECEDVELILKNAKTYRFYVVGPRI